MKVLFVCSGNTCRSPIAHGYFNYLAEKKGLATSISSQSAGVSAIKGDSVSLNSIQALKELYNIDISDYKSKKLDFKDIKEANIVLVMTKSHKQLLTAVLPEMEDKIHLLSDYAVGKNIGVDISDPYGQDIEKYKEVATQIAKYIDKVMEKINK